MQKERPCLFSLLPYNWKLVRKNGFSICEPYGSLGKLIRYQEDTATKPDEASLEKVISVLI